MNLWVSVREAARSAWAMKVASALVLLVVGAVSATAVLTVGQAQAHDRQIRQRLSDAGARVLVVTDGTGNHLINQATLQSVANLTTVEVAVALSNPIDVTSGLLPGTPRVPAWEVSSVELLAQGVRGNLPQPGQGLVSEQSMDSLRLGEPMGYVVADQFVQFPVVGQIVLRSEFEELQTGVLVQGDAETDFTVLRVVIDDMANVVQTQRAVLSILGPADPTRLQVSSPQGLVLANELVSGDLAAYNQGLLLTILGAGAFFVAVVTLTDVMLHRRDLGRRRALGISRGDLAFLTTLRSALPALVGASLGVVGACVYLGVDGIFVPWDFAGAVVVLAVLSATVAAFVPAVWAARRDPVSVLRTP